MTLDDKYIPQFSVDFSTMEVMAENVIDGKMAVVDGDLVVND